MRPSAAFWSTTTFVVSGSFLPFAMSDSSRSTRKMMSMARALLHGRVAVTIGRACAPGLGFDYGTGRGA